MLLADIKGKYVPEALGSEDYLTSAIFGELRWVPPSVFWVPLFGRAKRVGIPGCLADVLPPLDGYSLKIEFWRSFEQGEPDLLLIFSKGSDTFHLLIEAKLNSWKSGLGEFDQLARYMSIMEKHLPAPSALLYLTPRPSGQEVEESLQASKRPDYFRQHVFTLQWQDILDICRETVAAMPNGQTKTILDEVWSFLRFRQLEFFRGFREVDLPSIEPQGLFAASSPVVFRQENELPSIELVKARW